MRELLLIALVATAGCRQATSAEVGAHSQAGAQSAATITASERGAAVNPGVKPPSAAGLPPAQVPMR